MAINYAHKEDADLRFQSLLAHIADVEQRINGQSHVVLSNLLQDFKAVANRLYKDFEVVIENEELEPSDKSLKYHQMVDLFLDEWQNLFSLISTITLGSSFTEKLLFLTDEALDDLGLTDLSSEIVLLSKFGEKYSLSTPNYSRKPIRILEVPISIIKSPDEYTVLWHELATIKVERIKDSLNKYLEQYRKENKIELPDRSNKSDPVSMLIEKVVERKRISVELKETVKNFLSVNQKGLKLWTLEWFVQFYEDACSVIAFGPIFIGVLDRILRRNSNRLSGDKTHPDRDTRLEVAKNIWEHKKNPGAFENWIVDDHSENENVAHALWNFIVSEDNMPVSKKTISDQRLEAIKGKVEKTSVDEKPREVEIAEKTIDEILAKIITSSPSVEDFLSVNLSYIDRLALSSHTSGQSGLMNIWVHSTEHTFYHGSWNH